MRESAQFMVRGTVTQVQDMATLKGAPVVQLAVAVGGGQVRAASVFRVDVFDAGLQAVARGLGRGRHVQCSGRLSGRINDRGYYNYSLFADAVLVEPEAPVAAAAVSVGGLNPPAAPAGVAEEGLAEEDIPF